MHTIRNRVKLRLARCSDLLSLQHLCRECFPVEYPESWYADLVSGSKYITIVATLPSVNNELVIGMIVAEYREIPSCRIIVRLPFDILLLKYANYINLAALNR